MSTAKKRTKKTGRRRPGSGPRPRRRKPTTRSLRGKKPSRSNVASTKSELAMWRRLMNALAAWNKSHPDEKYAVSGPLR